MVDFESSGGQQVGTLILRSIGFDGLDTVGAALKLRAVIEGSFEDVHVYEVTSLVH